MSMEVRIGILAGLLAYMAVYLTGMDGSLTLQNMTLGGRWLLLTGLLFYITNKFPEEAFRAQTQKPFRAAVLYWIVYFGLYSIKPGISQMNIDNGLQGIALFMLMHLIISFVLMLIVTFVVRRWSITQ